MCCAVCVAQRVLASVAEEAGVRCGVEVLRAVRVCVAGCLTVKKVCCIEFVLMGRVEECLPLVLSAFGWFEVCCGVS